MAILTEEEFRKHAGTTFYAKLGEREVEIKLTEVRGYNPGPAEQKGLERFSLLFHGPVDSFLPQQSFEMRHDAMGDLYLFLVPISRDDKGFQYEAVFNFYK